ncbi:MAG TPA: hypothetical protein VKZ72_11740 [Acidimicrobiales bacterium]|nr:hypothetical protein [Acidimicrobiales bacterium]
MHAVSPMPAPPPPPVVSDQLVRPPRWWYAVASGIAGVGIVLAVVLLVRAAIRYADAIEDFERDDLPAELDVHIEDPGGYSIYHEYRGADDDSSSSGPELDVEVTDPSGDVVRVRRYGSDVTYEVSGYEGRGAYTFRAEEPGVYHISASSPDGYGGIAVGRGLGAVVARPVVTALLVGLVSLIGSVVLATVVAVKRSAIRRRIARPPVPPGWVPGPPGYGPPGHAGAPVPRGPYPPPPVPGGGSSAHPPPAPGSPYPPPPVPGGGSSAHPPPPGAGGSPG